MSAKTYKVAFMAFTKNCAWRDPVIVPNMTYGEMREATSNNGVGNDIEVCARVAEAMGTRACVTSYAAISAAECEKHTEDVGGVQLSYSTWREVWRMGALANRVH